MAKMPCNLKKLTQLHEEPCLGKCVMAVFVIAHIASNLHSQQCETVNATIINCDVFTLWHTTQQLTQIKENHSTHICRLYFKSNVHKKAKTNGIICTI